MASESGFDHHANFQALAKSKDWPAVNEIEFEVTCLGLVQRFRGSSHYIPQRDVAFFMVLDASESEAQTNSEDSKFAA